MIRIIVNGETRTIAGEATVEVLLDTLGLGSRSVAVQRNQEILSPAAYGATELAHGDMLEIVFFIRGI
nr:sulfur carrier protein ThiS [Roseomonas marmotae]